MNMILTEIRSKKNRFNGVVLLIYFMLLTINGQSQNISDELRNEFVFLDKIFKEAIFLQIINCSEGADIYEVEEKNDYSFSVVNKKGEITKVLEIEIYKVKLNKRYFINISDNNLKEKAYQSTMEFVIISTGSISYRLFGFYFSDILKFKADYGKPGMQGLVKALKKHKLLDKKGLKAFSKSVENNKECYDKRVNKPCSLLSLFYVGVAPNINTILLPAKPLRGFIL